MKRGCSFSSPPWRQALALQISVRGEGKAAGARGLGDEVIGRFAAAVGYRDTAGWKAGADDADEDGLASVEGELVWSVLHGVLW